VIVRGERLTAWSRQAETGGVCSTIQQYRVTQNQWHVPSDTHLPTYSFEISSSLTNTRGVHPPLWPWCIFPLFQIFPYFRHIFRLRGKFSKFYLSRNIFRFSSAKISDDLFLSHRPQISNFPLFSLFRYISPQFRENYYFPPTFKNAPLFSKISPALHTFCVFRFSLLWPWCIYASPNARTGRPWQTRMLFHTIDSL